MEYKRLYTQLKHAYTSLVKDMLELRRAVKDLESENKRLKHQLDLTRLSIPVLYDRRQKNVSVNVERRNGNNRNKYFFIKPEYKKLFNNFFPKDRIIHPLVLKSDQNKVIAAYWELWEALLGYDLRKISKVRSLYTNPYQRDNILKQIDNNGFTRQTIRLKSVYKEQIDFDALFIQIKNERYRYYIFLIINGF